MAQGAIKKKSSTISKSSKRSSSTALGPKRLGGRVIAPKKAKAITQRRLIKKHSAGLTALTEKHLAQKAGHLEMLAGGKRGKKDEAGKGKGKGNTKGGGHGKSSGSGNK